MIGAQRDAMGLDHPLVRAGCTLLYNKLLEAYEPPFHYTHSGMEEYLHKAGEDMAYSASRAAHFIPADSEVDDVLLAFGRFVIGEQREHMLMAIGDADGRLVTSASIARGTEWEVGWPLAGLRELQKRIEAGQRCRVVSAHNHPYGLLHVLLDLVDIRWPGPSSKDRDAATKLMLSGLAKHWIVPEFYLVEDETFRRIKFPSWEKVVNLVRLVMSAFGPS